MRIGIRGPAIAVGGRGGRRRNRCWPVVMAVVIVVVVDVVFVDVVVGGGRVVGK